MKDKETKPEKYDADAYLYAGKISRKGYYDLCDILEKKGENRKDICCLFPLTTGGDPDAAFRIARALGANYEKVDMFILDVCKSAGTLLCIGAHRLIFCDKGELGPLDIQILKKDEVSERISGLDMIESMISLRSETFRAFESYFLRTISKSDLSARLAAEIATKLTQGLVAPIASKIDPIALGVQNRKMKIAFEYGRLLNENTNCLMDQGIERLASSYPHHGFVIDRKEARKAFKRVIAPTDGMRDLRSSAEEYLRGHPNCLPWCAPVVVELDQQTVARKVPDEQTTRE